MDDVLIEKAKKALAEADCVLVGAGSGLSTSAGYQYSGAVFERYFKDFIQTYGIRDMYSGGFYPFPEQEIFWAWWSRHIWVNRYAPIPNDTYATLLSLVKDKDYFVLTTNVDHCFQRSGFDKHQLFYTQGDYGLWQSSDPKGASARKTYDNYEQVKAMVLAQEFKILEDGSLDVPNWDKVAMRIPSELIPYCPDDGKEMTTNLRADETFVEDEGWHKACDRYEDFLRRHKGMKVVYFELGVGGNTPGIIKYPFWQMTYGNPKATYVCINRGEAVAPREIASRAICIDGDIKEVLEKL